MLRGAIQALMSAEADERCAANYGERSAERVPQRLSPAVLGHPGVPKAASWGSPKSAQDLVPGPLHLRRDPQAAGKRHRQVVRQLEQRFPRPASCWRRPHPRSWPTPSEAISVLDHDRGHGLITKERQELAPLSVQGRPHLGHDPPNH
jgi:hypothetical protein